MLTVSPTRSDAIFGSAGTVTASRDRGLPARCGQWRHRCRDSRKDAIPLDLTPYDAACSPPAPINAQYFSAPGVSPFSMLPISVLTHSDRLVSLYITSLLLIVSFCLQTLPFCFPVAYRYSLHQIFKQVAIDHLSLTSGASVTQFTCACSCSAMCTFLFLSFACSF